MAKKGEHFRCELCGNEVVVKKAGSNPSIYCCGQPMKSGKELTQEQMEKHIDFFDLPWLAK
jgi:desulfoferrodoxin-like iron-binding protein